MTRHAEMLDEVLRQVVEIGLLEKKYTGFCIGNTRKVNSAGLCFTPIRNTSKLVAGSVLVCAVDEARDVACRVDGKIQYILVDTEKKIGTERYGANDAGNIERAVREVVSRSTVLTYKGNDLTVEAIDGFLAQFVSERPRGVGGKKVAIIGAGNLGSKLALKLVERGAHVTITRRNKEKLETIVNALNLIKPRETIAQVQGTIDSEAAAEGVDILIGMTDGVPVITASMIDRLSPNAMVMDGGKGCFFQDAIRRAEQRGLTILRVDMRAGFEGQVAMLLEMERILKHSLGRRALGGISIVSGGMFGRAGEIVVDSVSRPKMVYGVADGAGDFVRSLSSDEMSRMEQVRKLLQGGRKSCDA